MNLQVLLLFFSLQIAQKDFSITMHHVGSFAIGDEAEEIYSVFNKERETQLVDRYFDASFSPALRVMRNGELFFMANIDCRKITSFEIFSPKFKTSKGVFVGANFKMLGEAYKIDRIVAQEGIYYAEVKELEMLFQLDSEKVLKGKDDVIAELNLSDIDGAALITSILIQ